MRVREISSASPLLTVKPDDSLALATQTMLWAGVRHVPVVQRGDVVGVLSERDVFRRHGQVGERTAAREPVHRAMSAPAVTIDADQPVIAAVELMLNRKIGCLPVLDRGVPSGIVTTTDILRHDADSSLERPATTLPPTVRTVMKRAPAVAMRDTLLFDAAALMAARGVRHLPVVDGDHRVIGILSDRDLRRGVGDPGRFLECRDSNDDPRTKMVGDLMTRDPITVEADAPITGAIEHLLREGVGALPVVDGGGKLVGIVSYVDVIQAVR